MFIDFDHGVVEVERPIRQQGIYTRECVVGSNVWVGYGACVLRGVRVGDNSIVGTNSVVTRDVPANAVVGRSDGEDHPDAGGAQDPLRWPRPVEPGASSRRMICINSVLGMGPRGRKSAMRPRGTGEGRASAYTKASDGDIDRGCRALCGCRPPRRRSTSHPNPHRHHSRTPRRAHTATSPSTWTSPPGAGQEPDGWSPAGNGGGSGMRHRNALSPSSTATPVPPTPRSAA